MSTTNGPRITRLRISGTGGRFMTSLCGGALALNLMLVLGLVLLLAWQGGSYFWTRDLALLSLDDGTKVLGEIHEARPLIGPDGRVQEDKTEFRIRTANRDPELGGEDFVWVREDRITATDRPLDAVVLERRAWGPFIGYLSELRRGDTVLAQGRDAVARELGSLIEQKEDEIEAFAKFEADQLGDLERQLEGLRLSKRRLRMEDDPGPEVAGRIQDIDREAAIIEARHAALSEDVRARRKALFLEEVVVETANGRSKAVLVADVVRMVPANRLGTWAKVGLYLERIWEFLSENPRESNTEGGIFPAIFGTVLMVFLMALLAVPLGVLAAIYLREYAKSGWATRLVRIAVGNLAGTPSIVFGVVGLAFFVYFVGGSIDKLFYSEHTAPVFGTGGILWAALTLALLTVPVVIVATEEGLAAVPRVVREGSLALGATRFETIRRVILPAASPAVLTGAILAMGRAAGEVAPLMIVGMIKHAPDLPIDGEWPFIHFERKFMHIGYHIYDVGFQSPNVEATKPLVSATALLLLVIVTLMNMTAIRLRNHLRARYSSSGV